VNVTDCLLKSLVYRGDGKEGLFTKVIPHSIQAWDNNYWSHEVIELRPGLIKDRYTPPKLE